MIHNEAKKSVKNICFLVLKFFEAIGRKLVIFRYFLFIPETSIFVILRLCFELNGISSIFDIPKIPEKSWSTQKMCQIKLFKQILWQYYQDLWKTCASKNNYCICSQLNLLHSTLAIILWFAHWVICPQSFPFIFIYWTVLAYLQDHSVFRMTGMDGRVGLIWEMGQI